VILYNSAAQLLKECAFIGLVKY